MQDKINLNTPQAEITNLPPDDDEQFDLNINPEDDELERAKPRTIPRRLLIVLFILGVVTVGGVLAANILLPKKQLPPSTESLLGAQTQPVNQAADTSDIEREVKEMMGTQTMSDGSSSGVPIPNEVGFPTQPPEGIAGTIRNEPRPLEPAAPAIEKAAPTPTPEARASAEHSIYRASEKVGENNSDAPAEPLFRPVRPALGTQLPVQLLGSANSLRSNGFVRFELTRDMAGEGWRLPAHTVFLGKLNGSVYDRLYVDLLGYIDANQRLVRLSGEVESNDGQQGLKGRRRKLSNIWLQALKQTSSAALSLAQASLSRGGQTTIIAPLSNGIDPLNREISDMQALGNRQDFVEVAAGTAGYILVTQLPPDDEQARDEHVSATTGKPTTATAALNESELADLLESGNPAQIRAAMPRMTPLMRQVAETVLNKR